MSVKDTSALKTSKKKLRVEEKAAGKEKTKKLMINS